MVVHFGVHKLVGPSELMDSLRVSDLMPESLVLLTLLYAKSRPTSL